MERGRLERKWSAILRARVLGLPFQLIYAVTGAFYGLVTVLLIPTVLVVFKGDAEAVDVLAVSPA